MKFTSKIAMALSLTLLTTSAMSAQLTVWEDNNKSVGISAAIKDFEKQYGCQVVVEEKDSRQHLSEVVALNDVKAKTPDVFLVISDRIGEAVEKKAVAPISFMQADKNKYPEVAIDIFNYDNQLYVVPRSIETLVVYYNKDVIDYPYETFADYIKYAQANKSTGKYSLIGKLDNFYFGYGLMGGFGAYVFGINGNGTFNPDDIGLNNEGGVKGLTELANYAKNYLPPKVLTNDGWGLIDEMFKSGEAAAVINGPWALEGYASAGVNYGVAPLPKLSNGSSIRPFIGAKGYVISATSENKDLAEKFLQFINQDKYALLRYSTIAELPPIKSVMANPLITNDDYANAISSQILNADPMPSIPQMGYVWGAMETALISSIQNGGDPKQALDAAVAEIKSKIDAEKAPAPVVDEEAIVEEEATADEKPAESDTETPAETSAETTEEASE